MKYLIILFVVFMGLLYPNKAAASGEQVVQPKSLRLDFKSDENLTIQIDLNDQGSIVLMKIVSKVGVYFVPKEELDGIGSSFRLSGLVITIKSSGPEKMNTSFNAFSVLIPYGPVTVNVIDGKEIHDFNYVRFEFEKGALAFRRRAISKGDDKCKWNLFSKGLNEKEMKDSEINNAENPLKVN